jgi:hypothetical protein
MYEVQPSQLRAQIRVDDAHGRAGTARDISCSNCMQIAVVLVVELLSAT